MRLNLAHLAVGGQSARSCTREGLQGRTDRARRVGAGPSPPTVSQYVRLPGTTTPGPAGLTGPLRCTWDPPRAACWVVPRDPVLPTRYTHPVSPPRYTPYPPTPLYPHTATAHYTLTACTYDRFETSVGEPRGIKNTPYSGSQGHI